MIANIDFIQKTFDRFNALCFERKLPNVHIVLTKAGTFLGRMEYKKRFDVFGNEVSHYDYCLKISTGFDLNESDLQDVIIHEMIHYYIAYMNIADTSAHGNAFVRVMNYINHKYGRKINISHIGPREQNLVQKNETRNHYLCVSTLSDGNVGLTVCASTKIFEIYRLLPRYYYISKMEWYMSYDTFFNRFPRSNTPKIYRISREELNEHLKDATALKCDGHKIEPL